MAKFKKKVLEEGRYQSPDGMIDITKDRIKHWAASFQKMKAAGLKIPIPWGHQSKASPDYDEREFYESKYNGGYLEDLQADKNGCLIAIVDIPKEDDAQRIGTTVREVSPQVETKWKDGRGKVWDDVITHIALVTHPVVPGQDNFEVYEDAPKPEGATRLSLKQKLSKGDSPMADEVEDLEGAVEEPVKKEKKKDKPKEPETVTEDVFEDNSGASSGGIDSELLDLLARVGLIIPDGTSEKDFVTALKASAATLTHKMDEEGGGAGDEGDLGNLDLSGLEDALSGGGQEPPVDEAAAAEPGAGGDANKGPVMEQQPAMTMSLAKNNIEAELELCKQQLENSNRDKLSNTVELLLTQGKITPVIADQLRGELKQYKLSLGGGISIVESKLETLKYMPEGSAWGNDERIRLSKISEESLPSEFKNLNDEDASRLADLQLKRTGKSGSYEF